MKTVCIRWGNIEDVKPNIYQFETQEQLTAFLQGVEVACGWNTYEIIETYSKGGRIANNQTKRER